MYSNFTMEAMLATAFGRSIDLQRGESDQFSKSMELLLSGFVGGQYEQFTLFHSKHIHDGGPNIKNTVVTLCMR